MPGGSKFMVNLLAGLNSQHLFGVVWMAIGAVFLLVVYFNYRKTTQRNFRPPTKGGPLVPLNGESKNSIEKRKP